MNLANLRTELPVGLIHHSVLAGVAHIVKARSYLEIGVQEGHSLRIVLQSGAPIKLIGVCDTWGTAHGGTGRGSHEHIQKMLSEINYRGQVIWMDGRSRIMIPPLKQQFDFVHVDGDHSEEGAYQDMKIAWEKTAIAMAVHDTNWDQLPEVRRALNRFLDEVICNDVIEFPADKGTTVILR